MVTEYNKAFIDTAPFIYFIEKDENNPHYFEKVKNFLIKGYENDVEFVTSVITIEEYMVFPYRNNQPKYIELFDRLIHSLGIKVVDIDNQIARKAAEIRAEYKAYRAMDSLQLAVACLTGCDLFLTNDKQLKGFREQKCIVVDDLE